MHISATLREIDDGCKISVRAVPGLDASAVCKPFGGGGHRGAAGASLAMPLESAVEVVADTLKRLLEDA